MRLIANEKSIPRIHLAGTLLIVLLLTVGLSGYSLWRSQQDAQTSFDRIEQTLAKEIEARLKVEMHNAISTIEFIRSQTEAVLRENIMQQVDSAYQIAEAIHTEGFKVVKWRWIIERTFGWLGRYRRLSKDYEQSAASFLAWVRLALVAILIHRFGES